MVGCNVTVHGYNPNDGWHNIPLTANVVFPGGEPHITFDPDGLSMTSDIVIDCRFKSNNDLVAALMLEDAFKRFDPQTVNLFLPYFPGARQDRAPEGWPLTAKVYANMINSAKFNRVTILDPHSDVTPALIDDVRVIPQETIVGCIPGIDSYDGFIAPDAGAMKKVQKLAKLHNKPAYFASKARDEKTGELTKFVAPDLPNPGTYLIVDDICDGGRTFIGLADALNSKYRHLHLDLYVTHGIFSAGVEDLLSKYGRIYSTDSIGKHSGVYNINAWEISKWQTAYGVGLK